MQQRRWVKYVVCAGLAAAIGFSTGSGVVLSTTICSETELAGMSYALDQYCDTQQNAGVTDPEAVVAFAASEASGGTATEEEIASIDSGIVDQPTPSPVPSAEPQQQQAEATPKPTPKPKSEYDNVGISIAQEYVNIRKKPNTESKILGKLYRGSAAKITKKVGDWVQIKSGKVTGYIKKEFLAIGFSAEKLIDDFGTKWVTVTTETLKVREAKNTDCTILTLIPEGETYRVIREDKEWVKIEVDGTTKGFVSKDYVKVSVRFKKAISIAEERAEARRKAAAEAAAAEAAAQAQAQAAAAERARQEAAQRAAQANSSSSKKSSSSKSSSSGSSSSSSSSGSSSNSAKISSSNSSGGSVVGSGDGASIASYALNFVGNRYVYGGTSLTNGTDCSGFTQSVFRRFGISLPRTSRSQAGVGANISVSSAKAGDLIFYASGGRINHVALCIGNGRVVHASNPSTGITTSNMYYRTPYCARRVVG